MTLTQLHHFIDNNNTLLTNPQHKTQILNAQLQSVFTQEHNQTLTRHTAPSPDTPPLTSRLTERKLLGGLDTTKSTGPDNIPAFILKSFAPILAAILQVIFIQSLSSPSLPYACLLANTNPLFKTGDRTVTANFRPTSLTSIPCKISKEIINHLDTNNILIDSQHGSLLKRSCKSQLITTLGRRDIKQVDAIILDFVKAFDKFPHKRLTLKLKYYGISGPVVHWITAFLTNWTQPVLLDASSSKTVTVTSSVPHGTVLGLLLFLLYINDLPLSMPNSSTRLFPDDSLLFGAVKTPDDWRLIQKPLDALQRWERT